MRPLFLFSAAPVPADERPDNLPSWRKRIVRTTPGVEGGSRLLLRRSCPGGGAVPPRFKTSAKLNSPQIRLLARIRFDTAMELSRERMLEVLREDFLDRDQDSFVKIRRTGRLGWESLIPSGGNYSDLLRDCRGEGDVIKEAYGMARDYIVAMDSPYRVILRLSPQMNCTDSKVVYLSTRVFDDGALTEGQKIDTFLGLVIHEGCHLKYTDFSQMASAPNRIVANLVNILEDERIERLCGDRMPGYANFLKAAKYYMFDLYLRRRKEEGVTVTLEAAVRLFNAIIALVRYPKALRQEDLEEFADYLWKVREIVLDFPETPGEVSTAAEAIYEVIREFFEKQMDPQSRKKPEEKTGGTPQESEGPEQEGNPSSGKDPENGEGLVRKDAASSSVPDRKEEEIEKQVSKAMQDLSDELGGMPEIASGPERGTEPLDGEEMAECVKRDSAQLAGICEDVVELGEGGRSVLYRAQEEREAYDESLRRIRKYIPAVARTLRGHCSEYQVTYRGMRSGVLDTGKLAEAFQGVQTVYLREGRVRSDRMAVCVLIDESGSMYGEKIRAARDLSVLLSESVATIPSIDLYVYGHTYGDRCRDSYSRGCQIAELQVYREKGYAPKKALGGVEARSGNLDSLAIREAAARMRRLSSCRKNLMFVITDGAPNERHEQLRDTVRELEKSGMDIVAVCIEPGYDPSMLYTHHVRLTDMSRLAIDLGKMIKKAILKNATRQQI